MSGLHLVPPPDVERRPASGDDPADPLADLLRKSLAGASTAPVPRDLVPATLAAVHDVRQARPGFRLAGMAAAAAVLVVGVGIALLSSHTAPPPVGPATNPSTRANASNAPSSALPVGPDGFPTEAFGLPVLSIAQARMVDPALGPVVVSVKGYLSVGSRVTHCPTGRGGADRLFLPCGEVRWFTETPQQVAVDGRGALLGPTGDSLSPVFPWPNQLPVPDVPLGSAPALGSTPQPVVLVGHVDDPLASRCDGVTDCTREFVVDAVAWAAGATLGPYRGSDTSAARSVVVLPSTPGPVSPTASAPTASDGWVLVLPGDGGASGPFASGGPVVGPGPLVATGAAEASVVSRVPGFTTLASIAVAGDRLSTYDPRLPGDDGELAAPAVTWLVRGWEAGPDGVARLATYAVPDAMVATVIRVTDSGLAEVPPAGGTPRTSDGFPIIPVSEAAAIRDDPGRTSPEPLAVAGWYQAPPAVPCPAPPSAPPALASACPDSMAVLMAQPEALYPAGGTGWHAPTGPSIAPRFLTGNRGTLPGVGSTTGPVLAVLVGHFHDAAAAECSVADRPTCEQQFVVERVEPLARAVPSPADDWRLSCHEAADCQRTAAEVAVADPLRYADAERVAVVGKCAPWMRCLGLASMWILVPKGWSGDPASLSAWQAGLGPDATPSATPYTGALADFMLAQAAGYTVTCTATLGPDCYRAAVAAAQRDGDPLEITDIHISDGCGSGWLRRRDGTTMGWAADCYQPGGPSPSPSHR